MTDTNPNTNSGPAERLMRLGESLLSMVVEASRTRIELMAMEFAIERVRLVRLVFMGLIFGIATLLGLAFASFFIIAAFWDNERLIAIAGVTLFYVILAGAMAIMIRRMFDGGGPAFAHTLDTLQRDYASIQSRLRRAQQEDVDTVVPTNAPRDLP